MRKPFRCYLVVVWLVAVSCSTAGFQPPAASSSAVPGGSGVAPAGTTVGKSLYSRLGGFDAIAAVTDDFLGRMIADRQLGRFFVGLSNNSKDVLRQHIVEFLCAETGGPCRYVGRDLGEVHTGLGITDSDWTIALRHLRGTLARFEVPASEKDELLSAIGKYREDIVGR